MATEQKPQPDPRLRFVAQAGDLVVDNSQATGTPFDLRARKPGAGGDKPKDSDRIA